MAARRSKEPRDPDVPRLPRGRGFKLSFGEILRIGMTGIMLVAVIVLAQPCASAVSNFVASFDPPDAQPAPAPKPPPPTLPPGTYVHLTSDMTPEQIQQAINGARDAGIAPDAPTSDGAPAATSSPPR